MGTSIAMHVQRPGALANGAQLARVRLPKALGGLVIA